MKKIVRILIAALFISFYANLALANGLDDLDKAKLGLGQSLVNLKKYDEAVIIFTQLHEKFPFDHQITSSLIDCLYDKGMVKEAIRLCKDSLLKDPDNRELKLKLARVLSWDVKLESSLRVYKEIVDKYPDWLLARRDRARVLGWDHQYEQSIKEYKSIIKNIKLPEEKLIRLEMLAKEDYYRNFDLDAVGNYQRWLKLEPDSHEALSDLGQVYSREMQWNKALKIYNKLLAKFPNSRLRIAADKVKIYSQVIYYKSGFEHYQATSTSRDMDEDYWSAHNALSMPIKENLYFTGREDTILYSFSSGDYKPRVCQRVGFNWEYNLRPMFSTDASYYYNMFSGPKKDSSIFSARFNLKPIDFLGLNFSYKRQDVLDNPATFIRNLKRDDYKIRTVIEPSRRLVFGADYMYSDYNDKNNKSTYGVDFKAQISYEPRSFSFSYRYEQYGFHKLTDYYFTPGSFHYNMATIEWRHYLNKDLFWGSNDTYYTFRYDINWDVHGQIGNQFYADLYHDWNKKISSGIEYSKKIYNHRQIYSEERLMGYLKIYF